MLALQIKKSGHKELTSLAQGHTAIKDEARIQIHVLWPQVSLYTLLHCLSVRRPGKLLQKSLSAGDTFTGQHNAK